jgi:tousled-like kinase
MSGAEEDLPPRPPTTQLRRPHSAVLDSSPVRRLDDLSARLQREQSLRQEVEQRLQRVTTLALEYISKYATAERELRSVDLTQKQQRLGTIATQVSGVPKWLGGIDVIRAETQIATLTKELQTAGPHRRGGLQADLRDVSQTLKQLTDERTDLAHAMQWQWGLEQSRFHVGDHLNDDRTGSQYAFIRYIGRGGFSEVWEALDLATMHRVAIKIQSWDASWSPAVKETFLRHAAREVNILRSTQHPNVVGFIGYFYIEDAAVALVMEICDGGDLAHVLRRRGRLPEKEARFVLISTIHGLTALRSKDSSVIHYDLKPGNILFDRDGVVKIADFGLSKVVECDVAALELTSQGTGTYYYAAPETLHFAANQRDKAVLITRSVDTWSLGIIFYEMLYGVRPFGSDLSQQKFAQRAMSDESFTELLEFPQSVKVSDRGKEFIRLCLDKDPMRRPTLNELAQNTYCKS